MYCESCGNIIDFDDEIKKFKKTFPNIDLEELNKNIIFLKYISYQKGSLIDRYNRYIKEMN